MGRSDANIIVAGLAVVCFLTPVRRMLTASGMPFWTLFAAWALVVACALLANTRRRER